MDSAQDDIDSQLLPIFLEEAAETIGELHATLPLAHAGRRRRGAACGRAPAALAQGQRAHGGRDAPRRPPARTRSRLGTASPRGEAAAGLATEALAHGIDRRAGHRRAALGEAALRRRPPRSAPRKPAPARRPRRGRAARLPDPAVRARRIDRFVNQAGEIGVARSRVEARRSLRRSLLDLTENVIRLRNQLREVEIQAEVQMQSRIAQAGTQHTDFDPLELDRYTRLQELTRMMAESVNDVTTVQQGLLPQPRRRGARPQPRRAWPRAAAGPDGGAHGALRQPCQPALPGGAADRAELGKRANARPRGGRIEVDRSVLEQMAAPLEHLLRNAVAHGIEAPAARPAAGKAETGNIELTVRRRATVVAIEIADDGAGLDLERIAAQARARPDRRRRARRRRRLTNLIFVSGFSTAREVSGLRPRRRHGRGEGANRRRGGRVEVASRPGAGTRFDPPAAHPRGNPDLAGGGARP